MIFHYKKGVKPESAVHEIKNFSLLFQFFTGRGGAPARVPLVHWVPVEEGGEIVIYFDLNRNTVMCKLGLSGLG